MNIPYSLFTFHYSYKKDCTFFSIGLYFRTFPWGARILYDVNIYKKRKSMTILKGVFVSGDSLNFTGLTACLNLDLSLDARYM
jgi:hypothetical protein